MLLATVESMTDMPMATKLHTITLHLYKILEFHSCGESGGKSVNVNAVENGSQSFKEVKDIR